MCLCRVFDGELQWPWWIFKLNLCDVARHLHKLVNHDVWTRCGATMCNMYESMKRSLLQELSVFQILGRGTTNEPLLQELLRNWNVELRNQPMLCSCLQLKVGHDLKSELSILLPHILNHVHTYSLSNVSPFELPSKKRTIFYPASSDMVKQSDITHHKRYACKLMIQELMTMNILPRLVLHATRPHLQGAGWPEFY